MWMSLASRGVQKGTDRGREIAAALDTLAGKMTPQQVAEGQRLAQEWKPAAR
jgi:hypothetical protein